MEDPFEERKKKTRRFDFFFDMNKMEKMMDAIMRDMMVDFKQVDEQNFRARIQQPGKKPLVMGFSFKMGQNGKPIVQPFGNVKPNVSAEGPKRAVRAPLVDINDLGDEIIITAELPGAGAKNIKLKKEKKKLTIDVEKPRFFKEIELKSDIDTKKVKTNFNNGIYEIIAPKRKSLLKKIRLKK